MFNFCYGTSPLLEIEIERIIKEVTTKNQGLVPKFFDCSLKEEENFFISLQTNSIFNSLDFLILKRSEILKSSGIKKLIKSIKEYNLNQKIILISYNLPISYDKPLPEYELTKDSIKNIQEIANFIDCTSIKEKSKVYDYIKNKLKITDKDCKELAEILGNDYYNIKNEVDKISIFLDGEIYSFDKIKNLISIDEEFSLKDLIDKFFKTKNPHELLEYVSKTKDSYIGLIYILGEEINNMLKLSSLIKDGKINKSMNYNVFKEIYNDFSDLFIGKNLKTMHPYVVYLKLNSLDIEDEDFYVNKLRILLELEYKMKSGEGDIEIDSSLFLVNFFNNER